jgi:hypothetical protein
MLSSGHYPTVTSVRVERRGTGVGNTVFVLAAGFIVLGLAACGGESAPTVARSQATTTTVGPVCCGNPDGEVETPDAPETNFTPLAEVKGASMFLANNAGCVSESGDRLDARFTTTAGVPHAVEGRGCLLPGEDQPGTFAAMRWATEDIEKAWAVLSNQKSVCSDNEAQAGEHTVLMRVQTVIFGGTTRGATSQDASAAVTKFAQAVHGRHDVSNITCP